MYSELYALKSRAEAGRRAAGKVFSQRELEKALSKPPYSITFRGQAISDWLPEDAAKAKVPRDADVVWAVVRLWCHWAEEREPNENYWRTLVDRAQPVRVPQPRATASCSSGLSAELPLRESNLPPRTACFTGRDELLRRLGSRLSDGPVCVVALRGMGGVGKTQLALEFAHHHHAAGTYDIVWWVRAEQRAAMNEDLLALAPRLGLRENADVQAVLTELGHQSNWLLIYDNVADPGLIEGQLPSSGHVILTSRSRGWSRYAQPLDIGLFTPSESAAFLCARTGRDDPEAAELAEALGHLPLALAQAASYCEEHQLSIGGYLKLFRSPRVRARLLETGLHSAEYPDSVATTWLLHVDHLRAHRPAALQLLRLCAFLSPDSIPLNWLLSKPQLLPEPLASAANGLDEQLAGIVEQIRGIPFEDLEDVIGELVKTGLITRLTDTDVSIHRLVQAATKQEMGSDRAKTWRSYADLLVHALHPYPPFPVEPEYDSALTAMRIHGAYLAEQLRDGHPPEKPVEVKRLIALVDFTDEGSFETITDFEYTFECAQRLSQALHQATQPGYVALALANLGYARCLTTGRHIKAMQAMEAAVETLGTAVTTPELDSLHGAIRACRKHAATSEPADESAEVTVAMVYEHVDLRDIARVARNSERVVPAFIEMVGQNEISEDLATALGHDSDGNLPLPFSPLWHQEPGTDES
ncbi:FxSxx-COOH system tetratricopeptide repeat protein [Streptomyces sp. NPDC013171]|uniref:FxSxx-COOH system tetratricopeptide repeat protein n=1 Tax=Streptomyces sp. NPDC013171 TaxID=3364863 RepID=UPI0036944344